MPERQADQHAPDEAGLESLPASDPSSPWAGPAGSDDAGTSPERRVMDDPDLGEDEPREAEADDDPESNPETPPAFAPKAS